MMKKVEKGGIEKLMIAATDLSNFAMATTVPTVPTIFQLTGTSMNTPKWPNEISIIDKYNWLLHIMYVRGDYEQIQQFIRLQSHKNSYMTYIQALIHRQEGRLTEALENFQNCSHENPCLINIKQLAKSLTLLGRYRLAIDTYKQTLIHTNNDWEILHNLGLCYMNINELIEAKNYFLQAIQVSDNQEASYLSLGKVLLREGKQEEAEAIYERGTKRNPESPILFTQLGLILFEKGNYTKAFECFGIALTFSPTYTPAIMAACQVIQKHGDADVALSKYRIIYGRKPECAQVWNNIGMCFFSKKKFVAAISCLKRANYLAPFEHYILYNLALVHLYLQQNASAAIFLQSAVRINKKFAPNYTLLGVALSKLNDYDNARRAFTYSLKLNPIDPMTLLNFAIFQKNTNASQEQINITIKQFHVSYTEQMNTTIQHGLDTSMLDIASQLTGLPGKSSRYNEERISLPSSSTKRSENDNTFISSKSISDELSSMKSKTSDENRYQQISIENQTMSTEPTANEQTDFAF